MPLQAVDSLIQKHYMWKMSEPSDTRYDSFF